jgi:hypothetical protein
MRVRSWSAWARPKREQIGTEHDPNAAKPLAGQAAQALAAR